MESAASRALRLLSLLQTGREWSAPDLASRLGVAERMLRRDIARLRSLGYEVRAVPGPGGGYRLMPGVKIPPLLLNADEVCSLVAGLLVVEAGGADAAAAAVRAKLEQLLPPSLRRRAVATALHTEVLGTPLQVTDWRLVGVIAEAIADGRRLHFTYTDQRGNVTDRTVEPYQHVLRNGSWYLVAYDLQRDDWRLFRLDRIDEAVTLSAPLETAPRGFPAGSIDEWLVTDFGRQPDARAGAAEVSRAASTPPAGDP